MSADNPPDLFDHEAEIAGWVRVDELLEARDALLEVHESDLFDTVRAELLEVYQRTGSADEVNRYMTELLAKTNASLVRNEFRPPPTEAEREAMLRDVRTIIRAWDSANEIINDPVRDRIKEAGGIGSPFVPRASFLK